MRERLVGLRHLVHVVALLDDVALALERVDDLGSDGGGHAHAVAGAGELRRPAKGERKLAVSRDRHRDGVGRSADAAGLDLDLGKLEGQTPRKVHFSRVLRFSPSAALMAP